MHRLFFLLLAATFALPGAPKWTRLDSAHLTVLTNGDRARALVALQHFEQVHSFVAARLPLEESGPRPRLVLFSSGTEAARYADPAPPPLDGPYPDVFALGPSDDGADRPVRTAYARLIAQNTATALPPWLIEGIAAVAGAGCKAVPAYTTVLSGAPVPAAELFGLSPEGVATLAGPARLRYTATAWGALRLLEAAPGGPAQWTAFVGDLAAGRDSAEAVAAYAELSPAGFESQLRRAGTAVAGTGCTESANAAPPAPVNATPLEVGLALAELDLGARPADAEAAARRWMAQFPERPEPVVTLALALDAQGRPTEAGLMFRTAAGLGDTRADVYRRAIEAMNPEQRPALGVALLEKALHTRPADPHLRLLLARELLNGGLYDRAWAEVSRVRPVPASPAPAYAAILVQAAWQTRHLAEARAAAAELKRTAIRPADRALAARLETMTAAEPASVTKPIPVSLGRGVAVPVEVSTPEAAPAASAGVAIDREGRLILPNARVVEGYFRELACTPPEARMVLEVSGKTETYLITDPTGVTLVGPPGATDLNCGAQKGQRVRIVVQPAEKEGKDTLGIVRKIEFL